MDVYSRGTLLREAGDADDITSLVELLMNQIASAPAMLLSTNEM